MPSGSEKDVLMIVADEGGESTLGRITRSMPCYSGQYTRCVVRSLGEHDYLDWKASGQILLTVKGRRALRLTEEQWKEIAARKQARDKAAAARRRGPIMPLVRSELAALRKIKELKRATKEALSQEAGISRAKAGLLLQCLMTHGLIAGNGRTGFRLTPEGLKRVGE